MRFAAIDPGLAVLAIAGPGDVVVTIRTRPNDDLGRRLNDLVEGIEGHFRRHPPWPTLVTIEGPSLNSPHRLSLVRMGNVAGVIHRAVHTLGIPILEIPPRSLKLHATGHGGADKAAMIAAARASTPAGLVIHNEHEADAWLLRRMTLQAYGLETITTEHEGAALTALGLSPDDDDRNER